MSKQEKSPTLGYAAITLILVIGSIIFCVTSGITIQLSLFFATIISVISALVLGVKFLDLQKSIMESVSESLGAIFILLLVGMIVAIWNAGGTLPTLIYYGLKIINPSVIVPLTFLLCAVTSVFTGTSFGSIATMGLVTFGIGSSMGISEALLAGAVISGSCFGDKMSPMSDTTNLAATMSGIDVYKHISSMLYTTIPATIISLIIYIILGFQYSNASTVDLSSLDIMAGVIEDFFNVSLFNVLPLVVILGLTILKVPTLMALTISVLFSMACAMLTQGVEVSELSSVVMTGFTGRTDNVQVDNILARGGMTSMFATIVSICFACSMGGVLIRAKIIDVVINDGLLKLIKNSKSLIIATMGYCYAISIVSGNQALSIMIPAKTMVSTFDKMDVNRCVLSRTCEDTSTLVSPLVPWSGFTLYACSVLGVTTTYIPYAFLNYIVPVFSILCALTGFGIWNSEGEKMWGKKEVEKLA